MFVCGDEDGISKVNENLNDCLLRHGRGLLLFAIAAEIRNIRAYKFVARFVTTFNQRERRRLVVQQQLCNLYCAVVVVFKKASTGFFPSRTFLKMGNEKKLIMKKTVCEFMNLRRQNFILKASLINCTHGTIRRRSFFVSTKFCSVTDKGQEKG